MKQTGSSSTEQMISLSTRGQCVSGRVRVAAHMVHVYRYSVPATSLPRDKQYSTVTLPVKSSAGSANGSQIELKKHKQNKRFGTYIVDVSKSSAVMTSPQDLRLRASVFVVVH